MPGQRTCTLPATDEDTQPIDAKDAAPACVGCPGQWNSSAPGNVGHNVNLQHDTQGTAGYSSHTHAPALPI